MDQNYTERQTRKRELGLCRSCSLPALPGKRYCERHRLVLSENQKKYRQRKKAAGKCTYPGCHKTTSAAYCRLHLEKILGENYRQGITDEAYEKMKQRQGGVCAICGRCADKLFVDHDHATNQVRELLCPQCNSGLGFFRDDSEILERAIIYLKRHAYIST